MLSTPKALRLHIALMGKVNSGKSSLLNLLTGQDVSITSSQAGTTTDVVEKNQELLPLGPITWLDTAGFGDETALGEQRMEKSQKVWDRADIILLVCEGNQEGEYEKTIEAEAKKRNLPLIKIFNKADVYPSSGEGIAVNSKDKASRDRILSQLKAELIRVCPEDFINTPALLGDLAPQKSQIVLLVPIDKEAPKGRLIMPQVQAIRDGLDNSQIVTIVKESEYDQALANMKMPPALVVCDSQVVDFMVEHTPKEITCTTFSILFARLKGDIVKLVEGASMIDKLQNGDKILIAESCTHHAVEDDIGRVKIPNWLKKKTGKDLVINHVSGHDFPADLAEYKLVIQCGGCMHNRREMLSRINKCEQAGVAITNYGVCISELKGVLAKVLAPFPEALSTYLKNKKTA